jgi:two-component system, chemotaxis family, chemotaxis protein CheY
VKTILLASDSKVTLELIKVYLIDKDVRVLDVRDGIEAMTIARVERPDLVLCDLRMPRLDGPGLCRQLAADPALRETPVVILTSSRDRESLRRCEVAGARAILLKPIGPHELYDAVQRYAGIFIGPGTEQVTRSGPRQLGTSLSATGPAAGTPPAPARQPWGIPTSKAS